MAKAVPISGLAPAAETRVNLPLIFGARVQELWGWSEDIQDPLRVRELHDMRISAKRLRYCLEFFSACFSKQFKDCLAKFKKLQDYLGEIHDCDVWLEYLARELSISLKRFAKRPLELSNNPGDSRWLLAQIQSMRVEVEAGPVPGLLLLMEDVAERRGRLYDEFVAYWNGLEQDGFRAELTALVAEASRSGEAELGRTSLN